MVMSGELLLTGGFSAGSPAVLAARLAVSPPAAVTAASAPPSDSPAAAAMTTQSAWLGVPSPELGACVPAASPACADCAVTRELARTAGS